MKTKFKLKQCLDIIPRDFCLKYFLKVRKRNEFQKKSSKFWVLKIAGKTYTSILVPLFRSEKDLVLLVMPNFHFSAYC